MIWIYIYIHHHAFNCLDLCKGNSYIIHKLPLSPIGYHFILRLHACPNSNVFIIESFSKYVILRFATTLQYVKSKKMEFLLHILHAIKYFINMPVLIAQCTRGLWRAVLCYVNHEAYSYIQSEVTFKIESLSIRLLKKKSANFVSKCWVSNCSTNLG